MSILRFHRLEPLVLWTLSKNKFVAHITVKTSDLSLHRGCMIYRIILLQMGRNRNKNSQKPKQNANSIKTSILVDSFPLESQLECVNLQPSTTETDVAFKPYKGNSARVQGRKYFVSSMCQVCKGGVGRGEHCAECHLVSYCSAEHRREHSEEHRELCSAVRAVCRARGAQHILEGAQDTTPDTYRLLRYSSVW